MDFTLSSGFFYLLEEKSLPIHNFSLYADWEDENKARERPQS